MCSTVGSCDLTGDCATCQGCAMNGSCKSAADACTNNPECNALLACLDACSDDACGQACTDQHPNGVSDASTYVSCVVCDACYYDCDGAAYCG
jgi:hypothetical protein